MNRASLLLLLLPLLQLCSIGSCQVNQNQQQILYVKRINISQCPIDINITECQKLDTIVTVASNTNILFEEGLHMLNNTIVVDNCHNFTISGEGSALHSKDGLPQPTSKIYCDKTSSVGLFFSNSSNISIKNLEIMKNISVIAISLPFVIQTLIIILLSILVVPCTWPITIMLL